MTYIPVLALWLLARVRRYGIVHVHLANWQADVAGVACRLFQIPLYVKIAAGGPRGEIARMRKIAWLTRYVGIRSAGRVQATSAEIELDVRSIDVPISRIVRVPNGLPSESFEAIGSSDRQRVRRELELPLDQVLVLYAGRFAGYKGVLDLIEAWSSLNPKIRATLVMVGEPALDDPVEISPASRVIVHPWTHNVAFYLQACDIYVHPSHSDGMPNVVLEAMSCGMAVIATRIAALPEMITDGVDGILIDVGATETLRTSIERLVEDGALRSELGRRASARAHRDYPLPRVVDRIESAYREMLRERTS